MRRELENYNSQPTAAYVHDRLTEWVKLLRDTVQVSEALDPTTLPAEQAEAVKHAKELLSTLSAESIAINTLMSDMASYVSRLEYQRESSRKMFEAGWQALYTDMQALFVGKSYEQVRQILARIEHDPLDF